eukprot:gene23480-29698_t
MVVDESLIELEVKKRQDVLKKKAISVLREKEQRFQEAMYKDKMEKKKRIKLRKERQRFEANLMETRRLEQIAMAREALSKKGDAPPSASSSSKHAAFEPTEDAIMELEDYHNPAGGGGLSAQQSEVSLVVPTSAENKEMIVGDFEHDDDDDDEEEEEDEEAEEDGPETSFSDLSRHDRSTSSRHNRQHAHHQKSGGYVDERRGLFSDDESDFHDDSEASGDVRDFSYAHGGVVSGDNSNICRLGDTRLFSDTNNGEEYSEYTPKAGQNRDIESGLESPDLDEDTQTRTRSVRTGFAGFGSSKSRNSNKYKQGNNNVDDHSKLNSRCESFSGQDIYSKDNSYSYSFAQERRNGHDGGEDSDDCSVIDERTAENSVLVAGLSVECLLV